MVTPLISTQNSSLCLACCPSAARVQKTHLCVLVGDSDLPKPILKLIDGHTYKYHKDEMPVDSSTTTDIALKQAIQMTKMLLALENLDLYYADFHGENLMVKSNGDLVLTDFGASARITDRTGAINPKGFCANQILEKYHEKQQTPAEFRERLLNEHNSKQLLNQFKSIVKCVADKECEFMDALKGLNK